MIRRLLFALSSLLPLRIISDGESPYLERYYVGTVPWVGTRVYLHRFIGSDPDRGCHDHPWKWALSLILAGHYFEERQTVCRTEEDVHYAGPIWVGPVRWWNWLRGHDFHRVVLPQGSTEVWSLFIHHPGNDKDWGFVSSKKFTPFTYRNRRDWWVTAPRGRNHPARSPR